MDKLSVGWTHNRILFSPEKEWSIDTERHVEEPESVTPGSRRLAQMTFCSTAPLP